MSFEDTNYFFECAVVQGLGNVGSFAIRSLRTDEAVARMVAGLEEAAANRGFDAFREKLVKEWSF